MNALVVTFDRLPVQFLACYGNSWIETPHFDRLAAQAVVFDQHFTAAVDDARSGTGACGAASILERIAASGIRTELIAESGADPLNMPRKGFDSVRECHGESGLDAAPKRTAIAQTFDAALTAIEARFTGTPSSLIWVHSRGVPVPWIAPRDYATFYLDLVDEEPADATAADEDNAELDENHSLDEIDVDDDAEEESGYSGAGELRLLDFSKEEFDRFLAAHASYPASDAGCKALSASDRRVARSLYGGYVTLIDREIGRLLDAVERIQNDDPLLVIVTSARGEVHSGVSDLHNSALNLSDDVVHTPLFLWERTTGEATLGGRRQALARSIDLWPTLAAWFGVAFSDKAGGGWNLLPVVRNETLEVREEIIISAPGATAIRTHDFYLVRTDTKPGESELAVQLFVKPEDVWEVSNVAAQFPEVVESLLARLESSVQRP